MALNRTEIKSQVTTKIVPKVTNTVHIDLLNNDVIDNIVVREDIVATETPIGSNVTVDFSDKDLAIITTAVNLTVSISAANIANGDSAKYIQITKGLGDTVTFSDATDITPDPENVDDNMTLVVYQVVRKNAITYVNAINSLLSKAANAFTSDNFDFLTAASLKLLSTPIIVTNDPTYVTSGTIQCSLNALGQKELRIDVVFSASATGGSVVIGSTTNTSIYATLDEDNIFYCSSIDFPIKISFVIYPTYMEIIGTTEVPTAMSGKTVKFLVVYR